jgi:hypothetical protein
MKAVGFLPVFFDPDVSDAGADSNDNRCDANLSFSYTLFLRHVRAPDFIFVSLLVWLMLLQRHQPSK